MSHINHNWIRTTFHKPTFCNACDHLLVGLWRQGYKCAICNSIAHETCLSQNSKCNSDQQQRQEEQQQQQQQYSQAFASTSSNSPHIVPLPLSRQQQQDPEKEKMGLMDKLISHTKAESRAMKLGKDSQQPLNLFTTTPRHFSKFVNRLGPVVDAYEQVVQILTWENKWKTGAVLMAFVFLCKFCIAHLMCLFGFACTARESLCTSQSNRPLNHRYISHLDHHCPPTSPYGIHAKHLLQTCNTTNEARTQAIKQGGVQTQFTVSAKQ